MNKVQLEKNQKGIVSFFVVMIIMVVLTLIVLAFSQLVRREQRQTLDRQLQAQAIYAAESGVNDAIDWLTNNPNYDPDDWGGECDDFITHAGLTNQLNSVTSYSCLLVEPSPDTLEYDVPTGESAAFQLQPDGAPITQMEISWTGEGNTISGCPAVGTHTGDGTNGSQPCEIGMLGLEIIPFNSPTPRAGLTDNRFVAYVQPQSSGSGSISFGASSGREQGQSAGASCSGGTCTLTITGVPDISSGYMRVSSFYQDSNVAIEASSSSGGTLAMLGVQVEIDATGRANDVLHRIKVNAPIGAEGDGPAPEAALQTRRTQCKRFAIAPDSALNLVPFGFGGSLPEECEPDQGLD